MQQIRGGNTKPERLIRKELYARGLRYRLQEKLPLPRGLLKRSFARCDFFVLKHRVAVFVHGCFFHGHGCNLFKWPDPKTSKTDWAEKIATNCRRDAAIESALVSEGVRTLVIWQCAMRGPFRRPLAEVADRAAELIRGEEIYMEIAGKDALKAQRVVEV